MVCRKKERNARVKAAAQLFFDNFGSDDERLEKWQALCGACGIEAKPSIKACRGALSRVAVNIWDLLDAVAAQILPVKLYKNKTEMRLDLRNRDRRFPLAALKGSKENRLLRALLVTIA